MDGAMIRKGSGGLIKKSGGQPVELEFFFQDFVSP